MKSRPRVKEKRDKFKIIHYTTREWKQLHQDFSASSCGNFTQYIRNLTLKAPFDIYRNRSFDSFVTEIVLLRQAMQELGKNPLLSTEHEKCLIQLHEEIKNQINKLIDVCMQYSTAPRS